MWPKVKNFIIVLLMSGFIWVLAERQNTQTGEVTVRVVLPMRNDSLLDFLNDGGDAIPLRERIIRLQVEGPVGVIQKAANHQESIEIPSLPKDTQEYAFGVVKEILEGRLSVEGGVLNVQEADPPALTVRERPLVKRTLPVVVRSRPSGDILKTATLEPSVLEVNALPNQPEEVTVSLTLEQQRQAQDQTLKAPAEVRIGNVLLSEHPVEVKLAQAPGLETVPIRPRLGIIEPAQITRPFKVVIDPKEFDKQDLTTDLIVRGTAEAVAEYQKLPFNLLLVIRGDEEFDKTTTGPLDFYIPESLRDDVTVQNSDVYLNRTINYRLEAPPAPTTPPAAN